MILCRNCGKDITDGKQVRVELWDNGEKKKHIGCFCNYDCLDEWKIPADLN